MKWLRRIQLRRILRKAWCPKVTFDASIWGFVITMIDTDPVVKLLGFGTERYCEISKLVYEVTDEIIKVIKYNISDESLDNIGHGVSMNDMEEISTRETCALGTCIYTYEHMNHTNVMEWYIDYIIVCGNKYI